MKFLCFPFKVKEVSLSHLLCIHQNKGQRTLSLLGCASASAGPFSMFGFSCRKSTSTPGKAQWRTNILIDRVQPLPGGWTLWCYILTEHGVNSEKPVSPLSQFIWATCDLYLSNFLLLCSRGHYCIYWQFIKLILLMCMEANSTLPLITSSHPPDAQALAYRRHLLCWVKDIQKQPEF